MHSQLVLRGTFIAGNTKEDPMNWFGVLALDESWGEQHKPPPPSIPRLAWVDWIARGLKLTTSESKENHEKCMI